MILTYFTYVTCSRCDYTTYVELPEAHDEIPHIGQAPTCTEAGFADYVTCSKCTYTTYRELPPSHSIIEVGGMAPTCEDAGYAAYEIHSCAFYTNSEITRVVIPEGVTVIGGEAFSWCESLESVVISVSVAKIEGYVFAEPNKLTDIYYAGSEDDWSAINVSTYGNEILSSVTIHYNYGAEE